MDFMSYFIPLLALMGGFAVGYSYPKNEENKPTAPPIKCSACGCNFPFTANDVKGKSNLPYVECPICGTKHFFDSTSVIINKD